MSLATELQPRPGRPRCLTPAVRKTIITAIREYGMYPGRACNLADISDTNLSHWRALADAGDNEYISFFTDIKKAEAEFQASRLATIARASETNWLPAITVLERRFKDEYSQKLTSEVHLEIKANINIYAESYVAQIAGPGIQLVDSLAEQLPGQVLELLPEPSPDTSLT